MKTFLTIAQILILSFAFLKAATATPQLHKASDGKEYLIESEYKYNWFQASHECSRRNYQLVEIDTAAKNNAIIDLLKKVIGKSHNLWLGGNDEFSSSRDHKRPFFWSGSGKQFSFSFWSNDNPDNYKQQEHCVHIWASKPLYQWNDVECTNRMGFICEVNRYEETYKKELTNKCEAVKKSSSSISSEYDQVQKQQLNELNSKIEDIDRVGDNWKLQVQELQNSTQIAIQKLLDEQQVSVKQLTEKMTKEVNELNDQLRKTTTEINSKFGEKLNVKQNEITKICP